MKIYTVTIFTLIALISALRSQTLEWGSAVFSQIVDSKGAMLDNTYVFEVGAFADTFTPTDANTDDWFANWFAFDRADYSEANGYFASTAEMKDDGTSESPFMTAAAPSFEGLEGYIWVRNSDTPSPTTEWFLVTAPAWVFPNATPGCCDNALPIQWILSDLTSTDTPEWGSQTGKDGSGAFTADGTQELQTFTFVPEPSSALLALLSCTFLLKRRSRSL